MLRNAIWPSSGVVTCGLPPVTSLFGHHDLFIHYRATPSGLQLEMTWAFRWRDCWVQFPQRLPVITCDDKTGIDDDRGCSRTPCVSNTCTIIGASRKTTGLLTHRQRLKTHVNSRRDTPLTFRPTKRLVKRTRPAVAAGLRGMTSTLSNRV